MITGKESSTQESEGQQKPVISLSGLAKTFEDERNEARGQATFWRSRANDLEIECSLLRQELERRIAEDAVEEEGEEADPGEIGTSNSARRSGVAESAGGSGSQRQRRVPSSKRN